MTDVFANVMNMSIVGTMAIFMVLIARRFIKNKPKIFSYMLWAPVFFRLICPFSFSSAYSLIGSINRNTEYVKFPPMTILNTATPEITENFQGYVPIPSVNVKPTEIIMLAITIIWIVGILVFFIYSVSAYIKTKKAVETATLVGENIYETDRIESPFVMGINPKIYINSNIEEKNLPYIFEHERTHIRRLDYIIKPIAYAILGIHWFNPFVWLAFMLMTKDMEMSCDEGVLKRFNLERTKEYSYALLNTATTEKGFFSAIAFGENNVKSRIKNIVNYKKTGKIALVIVMIFCCVVAFMSLANPHVAKVNGKELAEVLGDYSDTKMTLDNLTEFDYDYVIQFPPYEDKKSMEKTIGFRCPFLRESVSEGMMNVLFVKDKKAVCYLYGYAEKNNFYLSIPDGHKIFREEIGEFSVKKDQGYPVYTPMWTYNENSFLRVAEELFNAKNKYIGDASANGKIIGLLTWPENPAINGAELQTDMEPYGITIDLVTIYGTQDYMDSSSYYQNAMVMMALIDNCGSVSFRLNNNQITTFTRESINENIGYDIRNATTSIEAFKAFLQYAGSAVDYN